MAGVIDAASAADPWDVMLDQAVDDLERELGHLDLVHRVAVERLLDRFGRDYARMTEALNPDRPLLW